ncbi:MAG: Asp-tRNA(Asn)/Glu-tRNA(Gln) amidotransferase GatCAB subunit A [Anaerolineae bacterium]|nr:MAG: Asp-tRNA(Asn)/Glu-tRNA(Gln) amidotransferase GatCAB subunit A [Anaerolineae bacterium]WKZ45326.1 MAG: Asp-tRNA(Asn)/Glu-tRNA(Gln) amidotransferase subunit GatA [Anaerolineales bacterium]
MQFTSLTIREAHELLKTKKISSVELTQAMLQRIHAVDSKIKSYVTVTDDLALEQAKRADERIAKNENVTPLTGIPFAMKDCISTRGVKTTCSSKILENYVPQYNATVTNKLADAGAVLVGKTNMDEFGMGSSCENSAFFNTHNPWNLDHVPGGSSGGSAAAMSASLALFTIGEDTGGSVRMPAGFCNVTGIKPTYGRVSRYGLISLVSSFDCIGPMTRDVYDCATVLEHIAGHDEKDSTTYQSPVPSYTQHINDPVNKLKLGIPKEYFVAGMEAGVESALQESIRQFEKLGMEIHEVSLPHTKYGLPVYYLLLFAEASSNLARFDGTRFGLSKSDNAKDVIDIYLQTRREGFGDEVKRRIMLGAYALSAGYYDSYYLKAQKVRTLLRRDFETALASCDLLLAPTCPTTAFKLGEKTNDPLAMYLSDIYVVATNPAGVPAMALPCGFSNNMPVGMQLIGKHLDEQTLFQVGHAYQQVTDWHKKLPNL